MRCSPRGASTRRRAKPSSAANGEALAARLDEVRPQLRQAQQGESAAFEADRALGLRMRDLTRQLHGEPGYEDTLMRAVAAAASLPAGSKVNWSHKGFYDLL